ncbi:MAG: flagellar biosynthetic protein FliR [Anaeromyxobacter sp.]|nr:flagellar biosynthetic protein FliR [Anaeromyxobacter sp.]MBL0275817.1 flagellar biosynthetic protein FliR [Anaeromyxobacter sp.]
MSALAPGQLEAALLHALRLLPVAALAPFLGGPLAPPVVRLALGGGAGLAAFLLGGARPVEASGLELLALAARELALGAALAVLSTAPVEAARAAGRLADTVRGATLAELHVAPIRQHETALGDLLVHWVVALAALTGGSRLVVAGLLGSFAAAPVGAPLAVTPLAELALSAAAAVLASAVAVAAPAVAGVLAADLAVSAVARLAPGLALPELVQPARAALGLLVVAAAASAGAGRLVALVALSAGWPGQLGPGGAP